MKEDLSTLTTEARNPQTMKIDTFSTREILQVMNEEDQKVALAVKEVLSDVEIAVNRALEALQAGGRIIYVGAGTSGRLGVMDAVECPPTFSVPPDLVIGLIAGGTEAFTKAVEGAEDHEAFGENDLIQLDLNERDLVIGIAASGRTPYVIGALQYAKKIGAKTVALTANPNSKLGHYADQVIDVVVGPEVLTGSTRLKAATAHKMILNMISTTAMIRLGKVYENLMVDVKVTNHKLYERAIRIIRTLTKVDEQTARQALEQANNEVKIAIVMLQTGTSIVEAKQRLNQAQGDVRAAIKIGDER
ncbi:N-acetylmuramic acid 6-phosphate etherase [Thermoflavimicrobium daqui]|uniref:N-acetylmuramic acid 6-phosphate etherase n=2 Tax=Thermoflavimicrobium daqui TaxID=2137476 RepID=A0A364K5C3_9BACL|nr:N-acetylmuramic acid 6-phosphate etherase [Thermoflavimicrobium daqui]RAL24563.1 N-acetylmuramic acid 6-phosphate etherase [Thermoflavimicrobium daqui]